MDSLEVAVEALDFKLLIPMLELGEVHLFLKEMEQQMALLVWEQAGVVEALHPPIKMVVQVLQTVLQVLR
jgi:hypothetical protein